MIPIVLVAVGTLVLSGLGVWGGWKHARPLGIGPGVVTALLFGFMAALWGGLALGVLTAFVVNLNK